MLFPSESSPDDDDDGEVGEEGSIIVGFTAMVGFLATGGRKCPVLADPLPCLCVVPVLALAPAGGWLCCWVPEDLGSGADLAPLLWLRQ